jgi:hypothetical protein
MRSRWGGPTRVRTSEECRKVESSGGYTRTGSYLQILLGKSLHVIEINFYVSIRDIGGIVELDKESNAVPPE